MSKRLRWLEVVILTNGQGYRPKADEEAEILAGAINVTTGNLTQLYLLDMVTRTLQSFMYFPAATASGTYALNPITLATACISAEFTSDTRGVRFQQTSQVWFQGVDGTAYLLIEVVKLDPQTGERLA